MAAYRALDVSVAVSAATKKVIDDVAEDYTVAMLMLKATNHPLAEKHLSATTIYHKTQRTTLSYHPQSNDHQIFGLLTKRKG